MSPTLNVIKHFIFASSHLCITNIFFFFASRFKYFGLSAKMTALISSSSLFTSQATSTLGFDRNLRTLLVLFHLRLEFNIISSTLRSCPTTFLPLRATTVTVIRLFHFIKFDTFVHRINMTLCNEEVEPCLWGFCTDKSITIERCKSMTCPFLNISFGMPDFCDWLYPISVCLSSTYCWWVKCQTNFSLRRGSQVS